MQRHLLNGVLGLAMAVTLSAVAPAGAGALTLPGSLPTVASTAQADAAIFDQSLGTPKVENVYWCGRWGCHPGWGYHRWGWHHYGYRPWGWGYHRWGWHRWGWRRGW
jgi:hypothetical protein